MATLTRRAARATAAAVLIVALEGCGQAVPTPASPSVRAPVAPTAAAVDASVPAPATATAHTVAVAKVPILAASRLAAGSGVVWVEGGSDVTQIDTVTGVTRDLLIDAGGDNLDSMAATPGALWLGDFAGGQVFRVDPASGKITARVDTGSPEDVAATPGAVWVSNHHQGTLTRVDPESGRVIATVAVGPVGSGGPQGIALGDGSLWVGVSNASEVVRLDPQSGAVLAHIAVPAPAVPCGEMLVTKSAVWVASCGEAPVLERIDPTTNRAVASITLAGLAESPVEIDGRVWLPEQDAQGGDGRLERIDATTNTVDRTMDLPVTAMRDSTALVAGGQLWVSDGQDEVLRIALADFASP